MELQEILHEGLLNADFGDLGDRSTYVGASDVGGCPRKVVFSKLEEPQYDLATLIRFARGHLAEQLLVLAFKASQHLPKWRYQEEVVHKKRPFKAHVDFVFETREVLAVMEVKTVSGIPRDPYDSWVQQVHFQMGLLKDANPNKAVRGVIFAIDLNEGQTELFDGFEYDSKLYEGLLLKASHIWDCVQDAGLEPETEKGPLCAWCPHRPGCPAYDLNESIPEMPLEDELQQYLGLKETQKDLKAEIDKLAVLLKAGIENGNPDGDRIRVGRNLVRRSVRHRTNFNDSALKKDHPRMHAKYITETSYEVLVVE